MNRILSNSKKCTGCGACMQVCPVKCISMCPDEEGFLYPVIDEDKCINCGKCGLVCCIGESFQSNDNIQNCYVAYSKNIDVRINSSSGGVFSALAEYVLNNGGTVFGAAFDKQFKVHHVGISELSDLEIIRRSKYVHSCTEYTYAETEKILNTGKAVLYSGTPCQIAGLKSYLRRDYENLITIDLVCFGVPSPALWERYLEEKKLCFTDNIKDISFRSKINGWSNRKYTMKMEFNNGQEYINANDSYINLFTSGVCLRPSCYTCDFRTLDRCSDITLADAWDIEKYMPDMDDKKGTSTIITHSDKGDKLLKLVENQLVIRPISVDFIKQTQRVSGQEKKYPNKRDRYIQAFLNGAKTKDLEKIVKSPIYKRYYNKIKRVIKRVVFS